MMLYICVKFHQNICNGFQLIERKREHSRNGYFQYLLDIYYVQKAATPKVV